jgi:hypothetical protein
MEVPVIMYARYVRNDQTSNTYENQCPRLIFDAHMASPTVSLTHSFIPSITYIDSIGLWICVYQRTQGMGRIAR